MTLIIRADIETLLIDHLLAQMAAQGEAVPVADELAAGLTTESLAVFRVGGVIRNLVIDSATLVVEAKGADNARSSRLLYLALGLIADLQGHDLAGLGVVYVTEAGGPAWLPKNDAPTRYTATVVVDIQTLNP